MYELFLKVVNIVDALGYLGIFIMTLVEGTFVPIPNEITLIPAGYLAAKEVMNVPLLLICAILGNLVGALLNYFLAYYYGRRLITRYGKYFFMSEERLAVLEGFFKKHGPVSVFLGRLLPGIKHVISFPAGLAKMDLKTFCVYTFVGGAMWIVVLVSLGYFIGINEHKIEKYMGILNWIIIIGCGLFAIAYIIKNKIRNNKR